LTISSNELTIHVSNAVLRILAIIDMTRQDIVFPMRKRLLAAISFCFALVLTTSAAAQSVFQPARGTQLRTQLLEAVRGVFETETNGSVEFVIRRLNVLGDWAFGDVQLRRPGGGQIDWRKTKYADDFVAGVFDPGGSFFLLHRAGTVWKVTEYSTGPTDIVWDGWRTDHKLPPKLFERSLN
jgi:hypothetical protein